MLEKPPIQDEQIAVCLRDEYGLNVSEIHFLPLGADMNTAVYDATTINQIGYFVKLRSGNFDTITVDVPKFLFDNGISQIIAPIANRTSQLSTRLDRFNLILYPFIDGDNGWDVNLSDGDWIEFGRVLKQIHSAALPSSLAARIPHEKYSPYWRERVKGFQERVQADVFTEPSAAALAQLLKDKQPVVNHLIQRAEDLCAALQSQPQHDVLCHSDIHVGNILISNMADILYIVDWDQPIHAPKERDLMFIGGGLGGGSSTPEQEETLFYQGYGQTEINPVALAYYRYERIVQDISAYCEQLLLTDEGGEDREQGLDQITSQFQPGAVIDMAYRTEKLLPKGLQAYPD
jgi:spectinomycin phosphotransferase